MTFKLSARLHRIAAPIFLFTLCSTTLAQVITREPNFRDMPDPPKQPLLPSRPQTVTREVIIFMPVCNPVPPVSDKLKINPDQYKLHLDQ